MMKKITISPIGYIVNGVNDVGFRDWKSVVSRIIVDGTYVEALDGIEGFSHLMVISWLHLPGRLLLKRHPRGRRDLPLMGVFATRSQFRPNKLGLHLVRLLERNGNELVVEGLDAVNGTPLVDIKPYSPQRDTATNVIVPEWVDKVDENRGTHDKEK